MSKTISKKLVAIFAPIAVALSALSISLVFAHQGKANASGILMVRKNFVAGNFHSSTYRAADGSFAAYCTLLDPYWGPGANGAPNQVYTDRFPSSSLRYHTKGGARGVFTGPAIQQIGYLVSAFGMNPDDNDPLRGLAIKQTIANLTGIPWYGGDYGPMYNSLVASMTENARIWGNQKLIVNDPVYNWEGGKDKGKVGQKMSITNLGVSNAQKNMWWGFRTGMSTVQPTLTIIASGDIAINAPGNPKKWVIPYNEHFDPNAGIGLIRTGTGPWNIDIIVDGIPNNIMYRQTTNARYKGVGYQELVSGGLQQLKLSNRGKTDTPKKDVSLEFSSDISSKVIEPGTPFHDTGHVKAKSNDPAVPATWPQREFNWRDSDGNPHTSKEPVPFRIKFHLWGPSQTPIKEGENPGLNRIFQFVSQHPVTHPTPFFVAG